MAMTWKCERDVIKPQLKDPDSYKHANTSIKSYDPDKNQGTITVTYRAKNSFGGYVIESTGCVF